MQLGGVSRGDAGKIHFFDMNSLSFINEICHKYLYNSDWKLTTCIVLEYYGTHWYSKLLILVFYNEMCARV